MADQSVWNTIIGCVLCIISIVLADGPNRILQPAVFNPVTFDVLKSAVECDFDANDICQWSRSTVAKRNWTRNSGSTPSSQTGPDSDHTIGQGGSGNYIYLEASAPSRANETAILTSPKLLPFNSDPVCFSFWYSMYGLDVGTLEVKQIHKNKVTLFSQTGNHGNGWHHGNVTITPPGPLRIELIASVGNGYQGDIAVDDLTLKDGKC